MFELTPEVTVTTLKLEQEWHTSKKEFLTIFILNFKNDLYFRNIFQLPNTFSRGNFLDIRFRTSWGTKNTDYSSPFNLKILTFVFPGDRTKPRTPIIILEFFFSALDKPNAFNKMSTPLPTKTGTDVPTASKNGIETIYNTFKMAVLGRMTPITGTTTGTNTLIPLNVCPNTNRPFWTQITAITVDVRERFTVKVSGLFPTPTTWMNRTPFTIVQSRNMASKKRIQPKTTKKRLWPTDAGLLSTLEVLLENVGTVFVFIESIPKIKRVLTWILLS